MPSAIVLNQNNLVQNGQNNTFVYNFPGSLFFPHHEIAVQSVSMFYAWSNITTALDNNRFSFYYPANTAGAVSTGAGVLTPIDIVIPTGQYSIFALNALVQYYCIQNGMYLINAGGQNVYYLEMVINAPRYAIQINTFPIPLSSNFTYNAVTLQWTGNGGTAWAGWTTPVASASSGTAAFCGFPAIGGAVRWSPCFYFPSFFSDIVGYPAGTYTLGLPATFPSGKVLAVPPTIATVDLQSGTNTSYISSKAPQVQPNSSIYLSISNIENKYATPSSIIFSLNPSVDFGLQINVTPPQFAWNKMLAGTYSNIRLQLLGLNFAPLQMLDPNMTIVLVIRDTRDESSIHNALSVASGGK